MEQRLSFTISQRVVVALIAVWVLVVAGAMVWLAHYKATPGAALAAPAQWPSTLVARDPLRPTLVMFVHPQCPCTKASVAMLKELVERHPAQMAVRVVVADTELVRPGGSVDDARAIAGLDIVLDHDGRAQEAFSALTSGFTALYDKDGALVFAGGITPSRGHVGANPGVDAIEGFLSGHNASPAGPTFGCSLTDRGPL